MTGQLKRKGRRRKRGGRTDSFGLRRGTATGGKRKGPGGEASDEVREGKKNANIGKKKKKNAVPELPSWCVRGKPLGGWVGAFVGGSVLGGGEGEGRGEKTRLRARIDSDRDAGGEAQRS